MWYGIRLGLLTFKNAGEFVREDGLRGELPPDNEPERPFCGGSFSKLELRSDFLCVTLDVRFGGITSASTGVEFKIVSVSDIECIELSNSNSLS